MPSKEILEIRNFIHITELSYFHLQICPNLLVEKF